VLGLTMACVTEFVEVQSHDGFRLRLPPWRSDADIAVQLQVHDETAATPRRFFLNPPRSS
jgi:hypothetical protein